MALFKSHTLFGKAGQWLKNSGAGQVILGAVGAVTGLGAVKVVSMAAAAIRDNRVKEEEIANTLLANGIPVTKSAIDEVKQAIAMEVKKQGLDTPLPVETFYSTDIPGYTPAQWVRKNLLYVLGGLVVLGVVVWILVKKPFGKKVGRRK